jgi:hypothetical protein
MNLRCYRYEMPHAYLLSSPKETNDSEITQVDQVPGQVTVNSNSNSKCISLRCGRYLRHPVTLMMMSVTIP